MEDTKTKPTLSHRLFEEFWQPFAQKANLVDGVDEKERYYIGKHYQGDNPNNFIRITMNIIADGIRKISSKLNGTPIDLTFTASDGRTDCVPLKRYDTYVLTQIGHEAFSLQSAINGENQGTEITYCRWNSSGPYMVGGLFAGGFEEEHLSMKNFYCSNPYQPNIQKMEWVGHWYDVYVAEAKKILKAEKFTDAEYKERLNALYEEARERSTTKSDEIPNRDMMNHVLIRVYVRHFRIRGEVCYTMETETVSLFKYPKPMSTVVEREFAKKVQEEFDRKAEKRDQEDEDERGFSLVEDLGIDLEGVITGLDEEAVDEDGHRAFRDRFYLYPYAVFVPKQINKSLFGRSMTEEMIPSQNAVNYSYSMIVKALENQAYAKIFAREGAMKPGEVFHNGPEHGLVMDHSKGNGNGFYTLPVPSVPADLYKAAEFIGAQMSKTYGFSDFMSGEMTNPETSGYAVALMLKQANSSLEQEQKLFWQYQIDLAKVRVQFYKHYVSEALYSHELDDVEFDREESARQAILKGIRMRADGVEGAPPAMKDAEGNPIPDGVLYGKYREPTRRIETHVFRGRSLWGNDFDIKINAQQGLVGSEYATQEWFTAMFGNGQISTYVENPEMLDAMTELAPKGVVPDEMRASLKHWATKLTNSELARLREENRQLAQMLQQAAAYGKAQEEQFRSSLNAAGTMVRNAQQENQQTQRQLSLMQQGASEGQVKSNNAKGLNRQQQQGSINPLNPNV